MSASEKEAAFAQPLVDRLTSGQERHCQRWNLQAPCEANPFRATDYGKSGMRWERPSTRISPYPAYRSSSAFRIFSSSSAIRCIGGLT
jgi:hypothetical protein